MRHRLISITYSLSLISLIIMLASINGPHLEAKFFPIVTDTKIIKQEVVAPNRMRLWFTFTKNRTCTFEELAFYKKDRVTGRLGRVSLRFLDTDGNDDISRPEGKQIAGPWEIGISKEDLPLLEGITRHTCHILWPTITQFYL